jgi:hypothetical protein
MAHTDRHPQIAPLFITPVRPCPRAPCSPDPIDRHERGDDRSLLELGRAFAIYSLTPGTPGSLASC